MSYKSILINELSKQERNIKQKIMITIPESILMQLDYYAEQRHMTRSGAITEAVSIWTRTIEEIENYSKEIKNERNTIDE